MKKGHTIFGGVFVLAGLVAFGFVFVKPVIQLVSMQNWIKTEAQVLKADVSSYQSKNDNGGYTTMYSLALEYSFIVGNVEQIGQRVSIQNISSSNSSRAYEKLANVKRQLNQNGHIYVWYDPKNPSNSIYSKNLEVRFLISMGLFSITFVFVGLGLMFYKTSISYYAQPTNPDPSKPWTTQPQWCSDKILSNSQSKVKAAWFFAAIASTFFGMFIVILIGTNIWMSLLSGLLLILPVWLFKRARKLQREWLRFKEVPLELTTYPGVVGGQVNGHITIPVTKNSDDDYTVSLSCVKHWTTRSGNNTHHHHSELWQEKVKPTVRARANSTHLAFEFLVPPELPESSKPSNSYHLWLITIKGSMLKAEFNREYEVPVFKTEDSITIEQELQQNPLSIEDKQVMSERLNLQTTNDKITFNSASSKGSLPIAGIGGLFFFIGVSIWAFSQAIFGAVFAALSTIFIGFGLYGWMRNFKVEVMPGELILEVHLHSYLWKTYRFLKEDIVSITTYRSSASHTNGKLSSEHFSLKLLNKQGKRFDLGGDFPSVKRATHLKTQIEQIIGIGN